MTAKSYGISVDNLIIGVGAALHYDNPEDAQSVELQQTIKDLQIILVDDGSPDKCGDICDQYAEKDKRIQVIHQELLNAIEISYQKLTSKQLA